MMGSELVKFAFKPPYIIVFYCVSKLEFSKIGKNMNLKFCFIQIRKMWTLFINWYES